MTRIIPSGPSLSDATRRRITHATEEITAFFRGLSLPEKLAINFKIWNQNAARSAKTSEYLMGSTPNPGSPCASLITID
ncbi:hypothetical protein BT96DRAFT_827749 [Gymnopus androsaceus JB14]|uniref:Uncharacterized protein n=1 Tax=Gymnopus androsaceus JB14 TaxID=1447944 RepID=A0A6A4HB21_9AGAR|nr:hypothetical protein BT96DRAFT_827749 [Gymnopus androsaceus JB14]